MTDNKEPGLVVAIGADKGAEPDTENIVPLSALAVPDEGDAMQQPEPGDKVSYTVEGKVARIAGESAVIEVESVNGQPVTGNEEGRMKNDETPEPDGDEPQDKGLADLQQMAQGTSL